MTRATVATHVCNPDYFAVCACGRPGHGTFSHDTRSQTAIGIEATFEFVEAAADNHRFTARDVQTSVGAKPLTLLWRNAPTFGTVTKTLRLMEHLGYIERVEHGGAWHPGVWRRALPVGPTRVAS